MIALEQIASLKEYLQTAQTALIILGPKPTPDQLAVASALRAGLESLGKEASVHAPKKPDAAAFPNLAGLSTELGKQNLVVEFDYDENAVDKVSYHIGEQTGKFYLTIKPKRGFPPLESKAVGFSYVGADADLIFLIGIHNLETLDQLYVGYETLYESAFVVTLHSFRPELGNVQFDSSGASSLSEAFVDLLAGLEISLTENMATDLLSGIEHTTDNLRSLATTAETFEAVAQLLRAGAKRVRKKAEVSPPQKRPQKTSPVRRSARKNTR